MRFQLLRDVDFQIDNLSLTARFDSSRGSVISPTTSPLVSAVPSLVVGSDVPSTDVPTTILDPALSNPSNVPTRQSADQISASTGAPSNIFPTVQSGKPTFLYSSSMPVVTRSGAPSSRLSIPVEGSTTAPTLHDPSSLSPGAPSLINSTLSSDSPLPASVSTVLKSQWTSLWLPILLFL